MQTRSKPVISKQEASTLLSQAKNHPLWNKIITHWTEQDVKSIKRHIQLNPTELVVRIRPDRSNRQQAIAPVNLKPEGSGRKCILIRDGEQQEFSSVVDAHVKTGISKAIIYNRLNNRSAVGERDVWIKVPFKSELKSQL